MTRSFYLLFAGGAVTLSACDHAQAGAPLQCTGQETRSCSAGRVQVRCCPAEATCNYRTRPFLECGNGLCTEGHDRGRCPAPQPAVQAGALDEIACRATHGTWQEACVDHHVATVCIESFPTNYTGPARNPPFTRCMKNRCTTSSFAEDCYPTRRELTKDVECHGKWQKVCLGGKAEDRCLPASATPAEFPATKFVTCPQGGCAVGDDPQSCR